MNRKIASHYALVGGRLSRNIVVEVDDSRQIVAIDEVDTLDNRHGVEFYPGILIPGMVNAHCHLELSYLRGAIAEGGGFATFAREIGRVRGNYTLEERISAASRADAQMWEEGVEAVLDIANDEVAMGVKRASKIEYTTLFELFGLNTTTLENHLMMAKQNEESSITPHSTYSLQNQIFIDACKSNTSTISVHLLESPDETRLYHNEGSLWEWYSRMGWECDFLHYGSPARRVAESIAGERRVVVVHGCEATKEDVALLGDHFANNITWTLCPESNRYISSLRPPVKMLREMGANIAIGSDSLASSRTLSIIENLRQLGDVPLNELLTWATINGAQAIGMEERIGSIELGKRPGLAVIEGVDLHNLRLTEESRSHRIL